MYVKGYCLILRMLPKIKKYYLLFVIACLSFFQNCNNNRDCFTIVSKIISDGQFLFIGTFDPELFSGNGDFSNGLNGFADVNLEVSQSEYNSYDVGDQYCYE